VYLRKYLKLLKYTMDLSVPLSYMPYHISYH
jgi:hypothetical protein